MAAGEQPAEGGEQRTGRGGDGCFGISNIPYLFSINKFNYLYLMHLKSKLKSVFFFFWTVLAKHFRVSPLTSRDFIDAYI